MELQKYPLFKCLVGSRAHGLNDPDSDYDYRGVFALPTESLLALGQTVKTTSWVEGEVDDTSWEIGHFLFMATKSNPSVLEALVAPVQETSVAGDTVRNLFPHIWSSKAVHAAFKGYSHNQRKKFLEDKDGRAWKFAVAYLRTLWQGKELLETGILPIDVRPYPRMFEILKMTRNQEMSKGEALDLAMDLEQDIDLAYEKNPDKQTNLEEVNEVLLGIRKYYWDLC